MIEEKYINQVATHKAKRKIAYKGWSIFTSIAFLLCIFILGANQFDSILAWSIGLLYISYDTWLLCYIAWKTAKIDKQKIKNTSSKETPVNIKGCNNDTLDIAVLVPVYNESTSIVNTIEHLLKQSKTPQKIIIINDGSTDDTLDVLDKKYNLKCSNTDISIYSYMINARKLYKSKNHSNLYLFNKRNSGKADSLNQVIHGIDCDIIITVDADTLLEHNAIQEACHAFYEDPTLVAACGVLKPVPHGGLRARLFGMFQYFEYLKAYLSRAAWSQSNALLLVSGAFAAYNKSALTAVGGYDEKSLVEDYELIHRLHKYACDNELDWHVDVIKNARATTDAPATTSAFIKQRKRWFAGFLRTQYKYRHMIGAAQYNTVGKLMLTIKTVDTLQPIFGLVALLLLWRFLITGAEVSNFLLIVIAIKLVIDYCFHIWSLYKYHNWLGQSVPHHLWSQATFFCLGDLFIFQPIRHLSALIGWTMVLNTNVRWEPIRIQKNNIQNF